MLVRMHIYRLEFQKHFIEEVSSAVSCINKKRVRLRFHIMIKNEEISIDVYDKRDLIEGRKIERI